MIHRKSIKKSLTNINVVAAVVDVVVVVIYKACELGWYMRLTDTGHIQMQMPFVKIERCYSICWI